MIKKIRMRNALLGMFILCVSIWLLGCASIPKEAPELSAELGNRISAIENAHINLLRKYMDEKRSKVDDFLMKEWVPEFAKEVFSEPLIKNAWNEVCQSGSEEDRLKLLTLLGPKIQAKINSKRMELITPLDELERTIERRLRDEYLQAKSINNSLTSFLVSAAEVAENRDRFLNMLGVDDDKISNALDEADKAVSELVAVTRDKVKKAEDFKKNLDRAVEILK